MKSLPLLTSSRLSCYRRCPREHYYRYELGLRSEGAAALRLGGLVHVGLEAWWRWLAPGAKCESHDPIEDAFESLRAVPDVDPFDLAKAEAMMLGYDARWADAGYTALAVEAEFRAALTLGNQVSRSWRLGGKLDVLARDRAGRVVLIEHKTSSEDIAPGSPYRARLRLDSQVSIYHAGARALGYEIEGCVYDVLFKPKQKPEKAVAEVKYTQEKRAKCKHCKGGKTVRLLSEDEVSGEMQGYEAPCPKCSGAGSIVTEPARPYANQRLVDETPTEYRARICEDMASDPERYFQRFEVVRLERELAQHDAETWEWARRMSDRDSHPRNTDSCSRFGSMCNFFPLCTGERRVDEFEAAEWPHSELTEDK